MWAPLASTEGTLWMFLWAARQVLGSMVVVEEKQEMEFALERRQPSRKCLEYKARCK